MYNKNIISIILFILSIGVIWNFSIPYREVAVTPLKIELANLNTARDTYKDQLSIKKLEDKIKTLNEKELMLLDTYVPKELHSGKIAYNLSQIASQNRLNIKNIQYSIIDNNTDKLDENKKLSLEFQFEGYYDNLYNWISQIEKSDTLIDIESISATKINNNSEILNINLKLSAYGVKID